MQKTTWPIPDDWREHDSLSIAWQRQATVISSMWDAILSLRAGAGASNETSKSGGASSSSTGGLVPVSQGGTGLTTLGAANQVLGVNNAGTALIYKTIAAGTGLSSVAADGTITLSLPNVGTPGTYGSSSQIPVLTTDAKGRVTTVTTAAVAPTSNLATRETPTGAVNGSNSTFTLAHTPSTGSEQVYLNGVLQQIAADYTISAATITFIPAPFAGDSIVVSYRY
jgi:hypothetical protein